MYTLLLILLSVVTLCKATCDPTAFYDGRFTKCHTLNAKYDLYWVIDNANNNITLGLNLHDTAYNLGWLGLGISVNGGMMGGDIAVVRRVSGKYVLEDRFATQFAEPQLDKLQNLNLIDVKTSDTTGTTVIYSRALVPCDVDEDQPILINSTQVIYAFGTGDIQYHNNNRGTAIVFFHEEPAPLVLPDDTQIVNITMPPYTIPSNDTTYTCVSAYLNFTNKVHIISWRPILVNPAVIHHMVLFSCYYEQTQFRTPGDCPMSPTLCPSVQIAWTLGQTGDDFTGDYALPAGGNSGVSWIVLQMHYNNPNGLSGLVDTSGISLYYTANHLRQYDVGVVPIALQAQLLIPPQTESYGLNSQCYGECTNTIPAPGITMINWFPHMHQIGSKIWLQHFSGGVEQPEIHRDNHYDFARQQNFPINRFLQPGDTLRLNCIWNSMSRTVNTTGGESSSQEMCIGIFQYYPKTTAFTRCTDYHNIPNMNGYAICTKGNNVTVGSTNYTAVAYPGNFQLLQPVVSTCPAPATEPPATNPPSTNPPTNPPAATTTGVTSPSSSASSVFVSMCFVVVLMLSLLL